MSDERSEGNELSAPKKTGEQIQYKKKKDIVHGEASGELYASKGRDVNKLFTNSFGIAHLKYESTLKETQTTKLFIEIVAKFVRSELSSHKPI